MRSSEVSRASFGASLTGLLPGLLLGVLFAQQLFFLNPHLPFSLRSMAGAMALYGGSGAVVSFLLLLAVSRGRRRSALRALPWALSMALFLAAVLGWTLPSFFGFYLAPGLNVRLAKAAAWITGAAIVSFYTVLLHSLYRRRYGIRSWLCIALCALTSVTASMERRGAFLPPAAPSYRPTIVAVEERPALVVVGLDGASLDVILPLAEQGQLPFFSSLLESGTSGHLRSMRPTRSAPLWSTVATGKLPFQHGVGGSRTLRIPAIDSSVELKLVPPIWPFFDWARLGASERLTDARDRRSLALWEILARLRMNVIQVAWPVTSPLDPAVPVSFSDRFFASGSADEARPNQWAERARQIRNSLDSTDFPESVAPWAEDAVRKAQLADLWRLQVALAAWKEGSRKEALFLHLSGLRDLSAKFYGGFHAVQFEGLDRSPYREAFQALASYYRWLDGELAALLAEVPEPRLVAVLSAYGAEPASGFDRLRAAVSDRRSIAGYFAGAPDGLLLLSGAGIQKGRRVEGVRLVDVAPTLLYGLGYPVAGDFDGQIARHAFEPRFLARYPSTFIPSFDSLQQLEGASRKEAGRD